MAKKWYKDIKVWAIITPVATLIIGGGIKKFWPDKEKLPKITIHFSNIEPTQPNRLNGTKREPTEQLNPPSEENPLDTNRTLSRLGETQLSKLTDQERIKKIDRYYSEQDYPNILDVIKTWKRVEDRDEQRIRFINKLIKEKKISIAFTFVDQLEMGGNIDKMKSKLAQEDIKFKK